MNDIWNKIMGAAVVVTIAGFYVMYTGPRNDAGNPSIWSHVLVLAGVFLFFFGSNGARKHRRCKICGRLIRECGGDCSSSSS